MTARRPEFLALVVPPRGRAVLCVWAAVPGALLAPFVFWQSLAAGAVFCGLWAALVFGVWARACSFVAVLGPHTLTVCAGLFFPVQRTAPRRAVTAVQTLRTPLLRLAGASLLLLSTPGAQLLLPAVDAAGAAALAAALGGGEGAP